MELRNIKDCDFDFFYRLKCQNHSIKWSGFSDKPDKANLKKYFENILHDELSNNPSRRLYIIENEGINIGYIGIYSLAEPGSFDMPIGIDEAFIGKGYASKAILLGLEKAKLLGFRAMKGSIREDNISSMKAYVRCGATIKETYQEVYVADCGHKVKMYDVEIQL